MLIDTSLALVFLGGLFLLWYRLSLKIPELVAIPDQVITERFHEDSARLRLFVLHIKTYYREEKHKLIFWKFIGKTLYKFHLLLLRVDNGTVSVLRKVKEHGVAINGRNEENSAPKITEEENASAIIARHSRVEEVVVRKARTRSFAPSVVLASDVSRPAQRKTRLKTVRFSSLSAQKSEPSKQQNLPVSEN